jgi:hypothetical protein
MVLEQNPVGKRPLGRPKLRWEDLVKRNVEDLGSEANWKYLATNRDGWRIGCAMELATDQHKKEMKDVLFNRLMRSSEIWTVGKPYGYCSF